ncbi:PAS domain-containing sensor histidine kinase [Caldimonas sp. KR1-144]|uniref:sensor histidine kinase n=1 Tax=Caldimonas sp. KR1-144 TaxID=3400911 RepID=UPI003C11F062
MSRHADDSQRFALLVDSVLDYAIILLDTEGRVMSWNAGAQRIEGWRADEIIGRSFETFYTPEALAAGWPKEELRRAARDGRFEDLGWRVCKDGHQIWASVVITALRDERGELVGFGKVVRDLTELKRQQEALRQSEQLFRLLVQSVEDYAIFMLDAQGAILTWNDGAAAIHGYEPHEVLGTHFARLFTPEDAQAGRPGAELARALRDGRAEDQGWRVRKGGTRFWADVVVTPVHDSQGALLGFAKVTRDLTEHRRLAELERSSQRMSEFLAMLAHELRNPLAPIRNAVAVMQAMNALPPTLVQLREIIGRQTGQLTRLVDDLLDVARVATGKIVLRRAAVDFREVVHLSVEAAQPEMDARGHRLNLSLPTQALPMHADAARLAQVLQNLLNNAARYTPDGGEIGLAVRVEDGQCVTVVSDSGVGLAPHSLTRIFELFVQEAPEAPGYDRGLGVGLALARMLVIQHGGSLQAHSEGLGRGSRFTLSLPLAQTPVDQQPSGASALDRR